MLTAAGVRFEAMAADVDEAGLRQSYAGVSAEEVALRLAEAKALAVSALRPGALVLGSDSVVALPSGKLLEKPGTKPGLRAQLLELRGQTHRLVSAAAMVRDGQLLWRHADTARLAVRRFSDAWLSDYLQHCGDEVLHSVGGYHVESLGGQLFDSIEGCQFVIRGLPLLAVLSFLRAEGVLQP